MTDRERRAGRGGRGAVVSLNRGAELLTLDEGVALAEAVDSHRDRIMACLAAVMGDGDAIPAELISRSISDHGPSRWHEDCHYHLDYLAGSAIAGQSVLFARYISWLDQVLTARGEATEGLTRSLRALDDCLIHQLPSAHHRAVETIIHHGLAALSDGGPTVQSLGTLGALPATHPYTDALFSSLLDQQDDYAYRLIKRVSEEEGYLASAVRLVQPTLYRLGRAWQVNRISIAEDDAAHTLGMSLLKRLFGETTPPRQASGRRVLLACVASNEHSFGLDLVANALELDGWQVECLGAATPCQHLIERIQRSQPEWVGLSVAMVGQLLELKQAVDAIREACVTSCPRLVGGGSVLNAVPEVAPRLGLDGSYTDALDALAANQTTRDQHQ